VGLESALVPQVGEEDTPSVTQERGAAAAYRPLVSHTGWQTAVNAARAVLFLCQLWLSVHICSSSSTVLSSSAMLTMVGAALISVVIAPMAWPSHAPRDHRRRHSAASTGTSAAAASNGVPAVAKLSAPAHRWSYRILIANSVLFLSALWSVSTMLPVAARAAARQWVFRAAVDAQGQLPAALCDGDHDVWVPVWQPLGMLLMHALALLVPGWLQKTLKN